MPAKPLAAIRPQAVLRLLALRLGQPLLPLLRELLQELPQQLRHPCLYHQPSPLLSPRVPLPVVPLPVPVGPAALPWARLTTFS